MKKTRNLYQYIGFIVFGVALILIQVLSGARIISTSVTRGFGSYMIHVIIVLGYFLLLGYAGLASLGTAGFVGLGTYITGYLLLHTPLPPLLILLITMLVGVILGFVVGFISLRIEGMYLAIITLALSEMLSVLFKNAIGFTGGTSGLNTYGAKPKLFGLILLDRTNTFYFIAVVVVILLVLTYNLTKSPVGRAMLSMKNSESAAQTMGVSSLKYRLFAFIVSSVFAMIAGFLYMLYHRYSEPTKWTINLSLNVLASVVIGGTGSIWGILIGTYFVFSLNDTLLTNFTFFQQNPNAFIFLTGTLMILVVMFYPGGISQLIFTIKYKGKILLGKLAKMRAEKKEALASQAAVAEVALSPSETDQKMKEGDEHDGKSAK